MIKSKMKKITLAVCLIGSIGVTPIVSAGIPVIDGGNLVQNIMSVFQQINQVTKQIEEYQKQLQQYETQIQNTMAPATYIWDQVQDTTENLVNAMDTLQHYKTKLGSLENYLDKYKDVEFYLASPCFTETGCTQSEWEALGNNRVLSSKSLKRTIDNAIKMVDAQEESLKKDAKTVQKIQVKATSAGGQMEALGYNNQLLSNIAHQLVQLRTMMAAQSQLSSVKALQNQDEEAISRATEKLLTKPGYIESPAEDF